MSQRVAGGLSANLTLRVREGLPVTRLQSTVSANAA
jgi:hypothetical protein